MLEATHAAELLREAGSHGMHSSQIAKRTGVHETRICGFNTDFEQLTSAYVLIAHVLRLLASHHILREVSPNSFALNRISSLLDTGKRFDDLKKRYE
jgi:hypothetical protein